MNFYGYKNPHNVQAYVEAKAEDMKNPKNPLSRKEGPIWPLALLVIGIILFIMFYPVEKREKTYTSLDEAFKETSYEEVVDAFNQRAAIKKVFMKQNQYELVKESFYLDALNGKIIEMHSNYTFKKDNCTITIIDQYVSFSQKITLSYKNLTLEDQSTLYQENDTFDVVFHPFENIDMTLDDQLYQTHQKETTLKIDEDYSLKCEINPNKDSLIITYEIIKK